MQDWLDDFDLGEPTLLESIEVGDHLVCVQHARTTGKGSGVATEINYAWRVILRAYAGAQRDGWGFKIVPGADEIQRVFRLVDLEERLPFIDGSPPPGSEGSMP